MFKKIIFTCLLSAASVLSFAQNNEWKDYFDNEEISIQFKYTECHNPAKGLHHENVLLRLKNLTNTDIAVTYHLQRIYNGKEVKADVSDFSFSVPAGKTLESSCNNLQEGLYVFSKIIDLKANSVLNSFELKNITINGKNSAR